MKERAIVMTTIHPPSATAAKLAERRPEWSLLVVGDGKTPAGWSSAGARFLSLEEQIESGEALAAACPVNHYARKNLGYLRAIGEGASVIAEIDDDNVPYDSYLEEVEQRVCARAVTAAGWDNVYRHFTEARIWPRGFPLELVGESLEGEGELGEPAPVDCPVQQYLSDGDPDVDAIYRLTNTADVRFRVNRVALGAGRWCPFNSQNTVWWREAFPLLYLPACVGFRITDIWRSFVAQVCVHAMGKSVFFGGPNAFQERNPHSLMRDFEGEIPAYLYSRRVMGVLCGLSLGSEVGDAGRNLMACYEALVRSGFVPEGELGLVELWLAGLASGERKPTGVSACKPEVCPTP